MRTWACDKFHPLSFKWRWLIRKQTSWSNVKEVQRNIATMHSTSLRLFSWWARYHSWYEILNSKLSSELVSSVSPPFDLKSFKSYVPCLVSFDLVWMRQLLYNWNVFKQHKGMQICQDETYQLHESWKILNKKWMK